MTPEQTLDWLAQQHFDQCREERPIQDWIRKMKSQLPPSEDELVAIFEGTIAIDNQPTYRGTGRVKKLKFIPVGAELYMKGGAV
jgi:hypothetical protein